MMSTLSARRTTKKNGTLLPLYNGDQMNQREFHRRYKDYPEDVKFELVSGVVYMASPLRWPHGNYNRKLGFVMELYASGTPGVEGGDNATTILGEESEPQPDLALRLLPEYGGQSYENTDQYIEGPPELLAEIAFSTRSIDMHKKREDYEATGVLEYIVLCIEEQELHWFHFPSASKIRPNRQGILRSRVFPGLWIDGQALLERDSTQLSKIVQQGLASREHAAFVKRLEKHFRSHGKKRKK